MTKAASYNGKRSTGVSHVKPTVRKKPLAPLVPSTSSASSSASSSATSATSASDRVALSPVKIISDMFNTYEYMTLPVFLQVVECVKQVNTAQLYSLFEKLEAFKTQLDGIEYDELCSVAKVMLSPDSRKQLSRVLKHIKRHGLAGLEIVLRCGIPSSMLVEVNKYHHLSNDQFHRYVLAFKDIQKRLQNVDRDEVCKIVRALRMQAPASNKSKSQT